jgi:hypothetical protein
MKILDTYWSSGRSLIGIVRVEDDYDGIGYYIAAVPNPSTEVSDAQYVADWGSTFPKEAGDVLFGIKE